MTKELRTKLRKRSKIHPQFKDLRPIRVYDFNLIPRYLLDQVRGRRWDVSVLLKYANTITASPMTHLYAFADTDHLIKGFFWGDVNPLSNTLLIHVLSVDKVYWGTGVLPVVKDFVQMVVKTLKLDGADWVTTRAKAFERAGFKRSNQVLMEL